jgi:hypothetical protein
MLAYRFVVGFPQNLHGSALVSVAVGGIFLSVSIRWLNTLDFQANELAVLA